MMPIKVASSVTKRAARLMKQRTSDIAQETGLRSNTTLNPKRIISEAKNQKAVRSMKFGS
jgi:hypothetical protein